MRLLLAATAALFFAAPIAARPSPPSPAGDIAVAIHAIADLDGGGKMETISFAANADNTAFTLRVGGATRVVHPEIPPDQPIRGFRLVRLDSGAKERQIAVLVVGLDSVEDTYFFAYVGKRIVSRGDVNGVTQIPGNGAVYSDDWMDFWTCHEKYALTAGGVLAAVPQAAYYVGVPATVKQSFPVRTSASVAGAVVANVAPGSKIELLLYQPLPGKPLWKMMDGMKGWYLVKTATGLCGWARYEAFGDKVSGLPFAG